ncbi:MAG: hypothetical protein HGB22_07160 [Chlorobiaceae bacterium]|nr:hypothetical protein [Chlorobiaceae bacterium]
MGSTLSPEDEAQLKDMIARHQRVRSKLSATDRATLDKLTEQVKTRLLPIPSGKNMLASTGQIINETIPGLAPSEQRALAEYCLGGIAAGDIGNKMDSKPMQEMQMSFNLQYLQLQSQMQNENRSYTAVSNIMKSKHDTVKNSISNVR